MTFVCYPKCSTCKKAQQWLEDSGLSYEMRDIKTEKLSAAELRVWWQTSGLPLRRFFNTSGIQYRALELKDKLPGMTEDQQLELLATDGMLVKRPLLIGDGFVLAGFRQVEWEQTLRGAGLLK